jgi:hypothetical protein
MTDGSGESSVVCLGEGGRNLQMFGKEKIKSGRENKNK